jgi:outer membrane protein TolC
MNLFQGGRTFHKRQQNEIAKIQTQTQINQMKEYLSLDIKTKLNEIERVKSSLEAQERNVKLAEKAYTMSEVRYKEGSGSQLEVLNADIALKQAKTNRLNSVYNYITAIAELDKILGKVDDKYMRRFMNKKQN